MSIYPDTWPRCPACGEPALDGHITCGSFTCDEGYWRRRREGFGSELEDVIAIEFARQNKRH